MMNNTNVAYDTETLLGVIMDLGREMIMCGAEVSRAEDSMRRLCDAYSLQRVEIFTITSLILVSLKDGEGRSFSQSKSIPRYVTNLYRLEELNALSRTVCMSLPSPEDFAVMLDEIIQNSHFSKLLRVIGYILGAGGFAIFFGGTIRDGLCAAIIAVAMFGVERLFHRFAVNPILFNFISSFSGGILCVFLTYIHLGQNMDKIMIGDIMLLIPGLMLTNAIKDMMSGDTMAGFLRICEAILTAIAIALGFFLAITATGVAI